MSGKGLSDKDRARLDALLETLQERSESFVGYPCNLNFDYADLNPFLHFAVNNVGDPFADSNYRINTHAFEREVLRFFAGLAGIEHDEMWGYVTNGGTEGNMYGLFLAREIYPDGIVYYSEDTHYSVAKVLRVLRMRSIMIRSLDNGEIDYEDLHETVRLNRDAPPIVFANIGTTMKGAIDNIVKIREIFEGLAIHSHYIHGDAALSGMILPFVEDAEPFAFSEGIDSLSISGHKMVGVPMPCGVVLARKRHTDRIARSIEYVGVLDTTLSGSRNGMTPLYLWHAIRAHGMRGFKQLAGGCLEMAQYAVDRFQAEGVAAWRNQHSVTVVFPRPGDEFLARWQVAVYGRIAHIITMPHVKKELIDTLADELGKDAVNRAHADARKNK